MKTLTLWLLISLIVVAHAKSQDVEQEVPKYDPAGLRYRVRTPLVKLKEAASAKSFDQGLSAELFISYWLRGQDLSPVSANRLFQAALEARTGVKPPEWWMSAHLKLFETRFSDIPKLDKSVSASVAQAISPIRELTAGSDYSLENGDLLIYLGKGDNLEIKHQGKVKSVGVKDWCPILFWSRSQSPEYASSLSIVTLEFKKIGNVVVCFGALESKVFVSKYLLSESRCELSFISLRADEYDFINCTFSADGTLTDLDGEPISMGGL